MKRILFLFFLLCSAFVSFSQSENGVRVRSGRCAISQTMSGTGYWQVSVTNLNDPGGQFDASDVEVGWFINFSDAGNPYQLEITAIVGSPSGSSGTFRVANAGIVGISSVPTTNNATISERSVNAGLIPRIANISDNEDQLQMEYTMYKIDRLLKESDVFSYKYCSTGTSCTSDSVFTQIRFTVDTVLIGTPTNQGEFRCFDNQTTGSILLLPAGGATSILGDADYVLAPGKQICFYYSPNGPDTRNWYLMSENDSVGWSDLTQGVRDSINSSVNVDSSTVSNDSVFVHLSDGDSIYTGNNAAVGSGIDTLWSYTALRAYTGTANAVIVKDWTYTYSGTSYTTWGGLFFRVPSGTENGGTLIAASNGVKWKRLFDGVTFSPMWWVVGGYGSTATAAEITTDCRRAFHASVVGGEGSTILYPKDYIFSDCERSISLYDGQTHKGNKTVVRRKATPVTTLAAQVLLGATSITVADASSFLIGSNLVIRKMRSGSQQTNNSGELAISNIVGNVITVAAVANDTFQIGDTVVLSNSLMRVISDGTNGMTYPRVIEGLEFDGNWRNNRYINDWRIQPTIEIGTVESIIRNCNFVNTPCSNIWIGKGKLENCRFGNAAIDSPATEKKMAGGLFHGTVSGTTWVNELVVSNCVSDSTNFAADSLNHDFALFTFSSNNINVRIQNGNYKNGNKWIWQFDTNDANARVVGGTFEGFREILVASADDNTNRLFMEGGYYKNCGDISVVNTVTGKYWKDVQLKNMQVVNGRLLAYQCNMLTIENNIFITRKDAVFTGYTDDHSGGSNAYIMLFANKRLLFKNNWVENDSILNAYTNSGVLLRNNSASTVGNDYTLPSSAEISGNTIKNFQFGLGTNYASNNQAWTVRLVNWNYRNNTIISMRPYSGASDGYCMQVSPGVVATGNVLFNLCTSSNFYGMIVNGVDDGSSTHDDIEGGIATNNFIKGIAARSILVGAQTPTTRNEHNAVVMYNICAGAITDNTAGQSFVGFNTVMDTALLPSLTSYDTPIMLNDQ